MKCLLPAILLLSPVASAQGVHIREVKCRPDHRFENTNDSTIIYPVIVSANPAADRSMNNTIRSVLLPAEENEKSPGKSTAGNRGKGRGKSTGKGVVKNSRRNAAKGAAGGASGPGKPIRMMLRDRAREGLADMDYTVTYNRNNILSLRIGFTDDRWPNLNTDLYFNFDTRTGRSLTITDLVAESQMDSFKGKVFRDKIAFLQQYKAGELKERFIKKEIDTTTYAWAIEAINGNCLDTADMRNFTLSDTQIGIIDPCELVNALRDVQPDYELKYSYGSLAAYLKPEFQKTVPGR